MRRMKTNIYVETVADTGYVDCACSYEMGSKDGKTQSLVIRSLTLSDAGVYTCKIGDRHTDAALVVRQSK